jgi:addiction module HigA family antidote
MDGYQLSPGKLAAEIKLSQSAVRQVIIGKTKISISFALRLAKYFGQTAEYWLTLQNAFDLAESAKDSALQDTLKAISKAKKPAPIKPSKAALALKKAAKDIKKTASPAAKGRRGRKASGRLLK